MSDGINWNKYLNTVIEHMYARAKKNRGETDTSSAQVTCSGCKMQCVGPNCDHCFHMEFITKLTPLKIHAYIQENKQELIDIITTAEIWANYTTNLSNKQSNLVSEYVSLFENDDLVIVE